MSNYGWININGFYYIYNRPSFSLLVGAKSYKTRVDVLLAIKEQEKSDRERKNKI